LKSYDFFAKAGLAVRPDQAGGENPREKNLPGVITQTKVEIADLRDFKGQAGCPVMRVACSLCEAPQADSERLHASQDRRLS
jgi:hypothetical protein